MPTDPNPPAPNQTAPRHVAVCIPSGEMVHADFMLAMLYLVQRGRADGCRLSIVNSKSSLITQGRNLAVEAALDAQAEWPLFLDSDMVFPRRRSPRCWPTGR